MPDNFPLHVACVAGAGAIGALARWGVAFLGNAALGSRFPYGTLIANVLGCFIFGLVVEFLRHRELLDSYLRFLLLTGFAGAFTTFSTFGFESYQLAHERHPALAVLNIALSVGLGLAAVVAGVAAGRTIAAG